MMTELTRGKHESAVISSAALASRRDGGPVAGPWRSLAGLLPAMQAPQRVVGLAWTKLLFDYWLRRSLRTLSDRQLLDAGIDPAKAGRGRAVDVVPDPNIGSGR